MVLSIDLSELGNFEQHPNMKENGEARESGGVQYFKYVPDAASQIVEIT